MTSREKILQAVRSAQPEGTALPPPVEEPTVYDDPIAKFTEVATLIGSRMTKLDDLVAVAEHLQQIYLPEMRAQWLVSEPLRVVSTLPEMQDIAEYVALSDTDPHTFQDVDVAIMMADFGVAENSALWVPETVIRVLPFICQHLVLLVKKNNLLSNMHQAYERMGLGEDAFGAFIAGPSKTADIEQSLVLGAHGPRSLGIYLIG